MKRFEGPIFLVGMPRSGTKLLRDLLNNHSMIGIAPNESHFIPEFYARLKDYGALDQEANFAKFYHDLSQTPFFHRVDGNSFSNAASLYDAAPERTFAGLVEEFYRSYSRSKGKVMWGDKTPFYLLHLPLCKSLFPDARFIHIIRDVRDYALSLKKTWHKNLSRSAQRWGDAVLKCRKDGLLLGEGAYREVRYEHLVDNPEGVIRELCKFLSVPFEENMIVLQKPVEYGGDARNRMDIVSMNYGKWRTSLSPRDIRRIEEICGALLTDLGYDVTYKGPSRRLGAIHKRLLRLADGFALLRFELSKGGIAEAYQNLFYSWRYSDSRTLRDGDED